MKYYLLIFLFLSACVSVNIEKLPAFTKAKNYSILSPQAPFALRRKDPFDKFWINVNNGNSITLLTSCGKMDPSLEVLSQEALLGINDLREIDEKKFNFNERAALQKIYLGNVDGIEIKILSLVFKKNHCNYSLSYFGKPKFYDLDLSEFQKVKSNFRVN